MPFPLYQDDYRNAGRDDVAQLLMEQQRLKEAGPVASGIAGIGPAMQQFPMTGPTLQGLPQTPSGGVPGSGLATAGPSTVQLPPQKLGMIGEMPGMAMKGMRGMGGMGRQRSGY